jgi:hypothetical protein
MRCVLFSAKCARDWWCGGVMNTRPQTKLSRWSVATATFGALCNLLILILTSYEDESLQHIRSDDWRMIILASAIMLAPSLVLVAFRHTFAVTFVFAATLLWILLWRMEYPSQYYAGQKYDNPGVTLLFLGLISAAAFSVWATIQSVIFLWRVLKSKKARRMG